MAESARIEELRRRVQLDPASIAFAALAEEYRRAGKFEAAVATCEAGLQRHPAYVSARVTLGRALLEMGRFEEARDELQQVLRVAPENLSAIRGLAEIHHRWGVKRNPDEAVPPESPEQPAEPALPVPVEAPAPIRLSSLGATPPPPVPPIPPPTVSVEEPTAPLEDQPRGDQAAPAPPAVAATIAPPPAPPAAPIVRAAPSPPPPITAAAPPRNPDRAALPALEGLLAAVRRVRAERPARTESSATSDR
jgi:hypothetical protein